MLPRLSAGGHRIPARHGHAWLRARARDQARGEPRVLSGRPLRGASPCCGHRGALQGFGRVRAGAAGPLHGNAMLHTPKNTAAALNAPAAAIDSRRHVFKPNLGSPTLRAATARRTPWRVRRAAASWRATTTCRAPTCCRTCSCASRRVLALCPSQGLDPSSPPLPMRPRAGERRLPSPVRWPTPRPGCDRVSQAVSVTVRQSGVAVSLRLCALRVHADRR